MMGKAEATAALRHLGLDRTVTAVYNTPADLDPAAIHRDLGEGDRYVARASATSAALNLPRIVDTTAQQVCQWAAQLGPGLGILVQVYSELAFCGQLAVYPDTVVAELVSGTWEMSAAQQPLSITGTWDAARGVRWTHASGAVQAQLCTWRYEPDSHSGHIEDWMIAATQRWTEASAPGLRELLANNHGNAYGLKFHHTSSTGVAAQNLYDDVPPPSSLRRIAVPEACPVIGDVHQAVPTASEVQLDVSVCREDTNLFDELIARLRAAGVARVYLRSGLLSHAAIRLREAAIDVRAAQ